MRSSPATPSPLGRTGRLVSPRGARPGAAAPKPSSSARATQSSLTPPLAGGQMLHKNFPFEFKNLDDAGTFEATVAVFNNVDKGGDRILPGAFEKTLAQWQASGDPIPVI